MNKNPSQIPAIGHKDELGLGDQVHFGCPRKPSSQSSWGIPGAVGRSLEDISLQLQKNAAMQATVAWHTGTSLHLSPSNELATPSLFLLTLHVEQSPDLQVLHRLWDVDMSDCSDMRAGSRASSQTLHLQATNTRQPAADLRASQGTAQTDIRQPGTRSRRCYTPSYTGSCSVTHF